MVDQLSSLKEKNYALRNITATNKYYTFLVKDEIWLGELKSDVLNLIIDRSNLLKKWGAKHIHHPTEVIDEQWLVFPNFTSEYDIDQTNLKLNEKRRFWIAYFHEIATQNEICDKYQWIYGIGKLPSEYNPADLLETYVMLWLLNVGDNMFVDTFVDIKREKLFLMDYELSRLAKSATEDAYFYFPKSPGSKCKWFEYMGKYYKDVSDSINRVIELSPEYKDRVVYAQNLLNKFYNEWQKQYSKKISTISSGLFPVKPPNVAILGDIGQPAEDISALETLPAPFHSSIGAMSSHTRGGTTFSGFPINEMRNYLEIYIQKGMTEQARLVGVELYRIAELSDSSAKSNFTSFINVLKNIAIKDIGIAHINLAITIIDFLNQNPTPNFEYIDGIIIDLSSAPKTRLSEQVWKTYTNLSCINYAMKKWQLKIDREFTDDDNKFIDANLNAPFFEKSDPVDLREQALVFYKRLLEKDYNAISWWNFFVLASKKYTKGISARDTYFDGTKWKRVGQKEPTIILWNIISTIWGDNGTGPINVLRWAYFNDVKKTESRFYFLLAILAIINDVKYTPIDLPPSDNVTNLLLGQYTLDISDLSTRKTSIVQLHPENEKYHIDAYVDISRYC